ncbi:hypothetical protein BGZ72_006745 [Mortierella alpina]|nr:hypothetical protein BGZ72_006745 [Mortierella alpina]
MHSNSVPDNQLILQRAADSCRSLDDLRFRLRCIQKQLANSRKARSPPSELDPSTHQRKPNDEVLMGLLQEAYTLQFQISTLLSATEEPIPERQKASTPARRRNPVGSTGTAGTGATATTAATTTTTTTTAAAAADTTSSEQEHALAGSHTMETSQLPHTADDVNDIVS